MFDWLDTLIAWLVYDTIGLDATTHWGQALHFFFYDSIKILILLFVITFIMGIVNAYFPIDRIRNFLSRNKLFGGEYLPARDLGAISVKQLLDIVRSAGESGFLNPASLPVPERVEQVLQQIDSSLGTALETMTVIDLCR